MSPPGLQVAAMITHCTRVVTYCENAQSTCATFIQSGVQLGSLYVVHEFMALSYQLSNVILQDLLQLREQQISYQQQNINNRSKY